MTGTFAELWIAIVVFVAAHSLPSMKPLRSRFVARLGERGYIAAYSVLSVGLTVWLIAAVRAAPVVELWPMTVGAMWVTAVVMFVSGWLLVVGLTTPNTLSIHVLPNRFDPARPGLLVVTRHPIFWALALWAFGHLVANGDLATAVFFALAGLFSIGGTFILDVRRKREMGIEAWRAATANAPRVPFAAGANAWRAALDWRLAVTAASYALLAWLHLPVIGVSPLPPF